MSPNKLLLAKCNDWSLNNEPCEFGIFPDSILLPKFRRRKDYQCLQQSGRSPDKLLRDKSMTSNLLSIFITLQMEGEIGPEKELLATLYMVICSDISGSWPLSDRTQINETWVEQTLDRSPLIALLESLIYFTQAAKFQNQSGAASTSPAFEMSRYLRDFCFCNYAGNLGPNLQELMLIIWSWKGGIQWGFTSMMKVFAACLRAIILKA